LPGRFLGRSNPSSLRQGDDSLRKQDLVIRACLAIL
jgi:hypothetical protein